MLSRKRGAAITNRLISAVPPGDRSRLLAGCEEVELTLHTVLNEPGDRVRHVYFPLGSFVSLVTPADSAASLEVGLVGNEGMYGISLALGTDVAPLQALVQGAGPALRMSAAAFNREHERSPALRRELGHYLFVLMCQLGRSAACSRFHTVGARMARWLLMTHDRAHSDQFHMAHEFFAWMLGVRRPSVTVNAGALQKEKIISYRRGEVTILDRKRLEAAACPCYAADRNVYEKMLGRGP